MTTRTREGVSRAALGKRHRSQTRMNRCCALQITPFDTPPPVPCSVPDGPTEVSAQPARTVKAKRRHSAVHAPEEVLATVSTTKDSRRSAGTADPRVRAFFEFEFSRFHNLKGVSSIAEHHIVMRDDKPIKQRYYPKTPLCKPSVINKSTS